ncbi:MAG: metallophosphoesterase [Bacteroidetes bacterium]|nr:MAG: metallophosphoesterase [Bacteroidota bacterium]
MRKIFLLSDTHSHWNDEWMKYIIEADEVWHAGDIGSVEWLQKFTDNLKNKTLRFVYGNIDNPTIQAHTHEYLVFNVEQLKILIIHIAGTFGKYNPKTRELILQYHPDILVCGHSHILKIQYDQKFKLWYINPGAAGTYGHHKVSTALQFEIHQDKIKNMKIIEWKKDVASAPPPYPEI